MKKSRRGEFIYKIVAGVMIVVYLPLVWKGWRPAAIVMLATICVWTGICLLLNIHPAIEMKGYSRRYCRSIGLLDLVFAAGLAGVGLAWDGGRFEAGMAAGLMVALSAIGMFLVERREKRERGKEEDKPE